MNIIRGKIPLRISFCGGGTDVDPFCKDFGGAVITSAINKYVHVSIEKRKDKIISQLVALKELIEEKIEGDDLEEEVSGIVDELLAE